MLKIEFINRQIEEQKDYEDFLKRCKSIQEEYLLGQLSIRPVWNTYFKANKSRRSQRTLLPEPVPLFGISIENLVENIGSRNKDILQTKQLFNPSLDFTKTCR